MSVPPSTTPQGAVEWLEPMARTGEGYFTGSFRIATMSCGGVGFYDDLRM